MVCVKVITIRNNEFYAVRKVLFKEIKMCLLKNLFVYA